jgi:hypothetical protein
MENAASHWKNVRNGVIVSVVMLYLIEPAMKLAVDIVPQFGGQFYQLVWDRAAMQASIGGDYMDFAMFGILFSAIVGAFIGRFGAGAAFPRLFGRKGRKSVDSTWVRWEKRFVVILMMLVGPIAGTTLLIDFAAQQMKLSFDRRIAVLAPAITEESEEVLRARFADLSDRADYQSLNDDMNRLANENRIHLPEPLL